MSNGVDGTESPVSSDLTIFRAVCKSAEEKFKLCVDLEKKNARLSSDLASNEAAHRKLKGDYDTLSHDALKLQDDYTTLKASKVEYEGQIDTLLASVKRCQSIIDMSLDRVRKLETQLHEAGAREETLNIYLDAMETKQEILEEELAALRTATAKPNEPLKSDNESRTVNDHTTVDPPLVAVAAAPPTTYSQSQERAMIETLQASFDRLTRRHERLIAKKESAEKKFYDSYVEWHNFKAWWCEFSKFPGVAPRIRAFNKETRNGTLARSTATANSVAIGAEKEMVRKGIANAARVVQIAQSEEQDPKGMFRALEHHHDAAAAAALENEREEDTVKLGGGGEEGRENVGPGDSVHHEAQRSPKALRQVVKDVTDRLEETCREAETQCEENSPAKRADQDLEHLGANNVPSPSVLLGGGVNDLRTPVRFGASSKDPSDFEKTQETTPSKSPQHSFEFDLTGIRLPTLDLYPPTTTRKPITPRFPSPDSPIEIKEESPAKEVLLRRAANAAESTIRRERGLVSKEQEQDAFPPTSLGKRKASAEDAVAAAAGADSSARKNFVPLYPQYLDGTKVLGHEKATKRQHREEEEEESFRRTPESPRKPKSSKKMQGAGRFEVNPARNNGVNYAYDEVVRNKADRKKMDAVDCDQCRNYYKAVGPLPPRLQPPLWNSPGTATKEIAAEQPPRRCKHHRKLESDDEEPDQEVSTHQKQISRHRVTIVNTGGDPEDYWEIGFPDTQRVKEINAGAEKRHQKKERMMEKEAQKLDGRYRYRK